MEKSELINELSAALSKAQGQIEDAKKDSNNPFFKTKYADLASVWEACRKPLSSNNLAVIQTIEVKEGKRYLETMLSHSSGQFIRSSLDLSSKEESMQAIGSAITYARRYSLSAIVGVCPDDDDDAEKAMGRVKPEEKPTVKDKPIFEQEPVTIPTETIEMITEPQRKKIFASSKQMGYQESEVKALLEGYFKKPHTSDLTKKEASEFIEMIAAGKKINEKGELV